MLSRWCEERLATTSEPNLAPNLVTNCREARGRGYWAATQVKGLSPEIAIVSEAETFHVVEGSILNTVNRQGGKSLTGSETVARYQKDSTGTREVQGVLQKGVCDNKPIDGKLLQKIPWESDQSIVAEKSRNGDGAKGLAGKPLGWGHFLCAYKQMKKVNKTIPVTYFSDGEEVLLKSRMWENHKSGSVRGLIVSLERGWL